jgi:transposase
MPKLTRAALDELIRTDPDRLFTLFEQLVARIEGLEAQVAALQAQLAATSHNSHRPPSSDPPGTPKRPRPPSGRRPGGQPGHPGQTRRLVATPDQVVTHRPAQCGRCGQALAETIPTEPTPERRQVIELRPRLAAVTEHRVLRATCPGCGQTATGTFPAEVAAPVQYGPRLKALGVYLLTYQLVPHERTAELLGDLVGAPVAVGTLQRAVQTGATTLAEPEAQIAHALSAAPVLHCDETGVSVNGQGWWLHVASTATLTHYGIHRQRGQAATDAIGILPRARGRLIHDHWAAYWAYGDDHGLCNAHHLRELTAVEERDADHAWATGLKALLRTMKAHIAARQAAGETAIRDPVRRHWLHLYAALLAAGDAAHPPARPTPGRRGRPKQTKTRNLLDRLRTHQAAVLAFLDDWRVPFDNNQAERDLRMVKVQQKVSGTFRTQAGAAAFGRWRGYLSTLRKHGLDLLDAITRTLQGQPPLPSLAT